MTLGKRTIDADAERVAITELQNKPFEAAQQAVEVARFILAGEPAHPVADKLVIEPAQATREPSSETVQNPAAE